MIKTRDTSLTIDQIRSIRVQPGEVLHVSVDTSGMPPSQSHAALVRTREYLTSLLPVGTDVLITSEKVTFTIIQKP